MPDFETAAKDKEANSTPRPELQPFPETPSPIDEPPGNSKAIGFASLFPENLLDGRGRRNTHQLEVNA
ncbi:MAG: hypothetical protein D6820_03110 [Lentisphaerae bacterium]|nr:MAG: hypothetical protein D6820_03110 [Lentisphaerota bacterium]